MRWSDSLFFSFCCVLAADTDTRYRQTDRPVRVRVRVTNCDNKKHYHRISKNTFSGFWSGQFVAHQFYSHINSYSVVGWLFGVLVIRYSVFLFQYARSNSRVEKSNGTEYSKNSLSQTHHLSLCGLHSFVAHHTPFCQM